MCDSSSSSTQSFELHLDQFQAQVSDLERRLVSVLSKAFENCCVSSAAKVCDSARCCSCRRRSSDLICSVFQLVKMFMFIMDRPLIRDGLRPHLMRLQELILEELDQTELLLHSQIENSETFSRFSPTAAAQLCWTQQLILRAADALNSYRTVQHL